MRSLKLLELPNGHNKLLFAKVDGYSYCKNVFLFLQAGDFEV